MLLSLSSVHTRPPTRLYQQSIHASSHLLVALLIYSHLPLYTCSLRHSRILPGNPLSGWTHRFIRRAKGLPEPVTTNRQVRDSASNSSMPPRNRPTAFSVSFGDTSSRETVSLQRPDATSNALPFSRSSSKPSTSSDYQRGASNTRSDSPASYFGSDSQDTLVGSVTPGWTHEKRKGAIWEGSQGSYRVSLTGLKVY
jgi:hypothetical protein